MLDERLKTIASLVDEGSEVIDVGCDHALLDIYLTLYNDNKCIATDISEGAIKQARKNLYRYGLTNEVKLKVCDGLKDIPDIKNKIIVLSGMGTETILKILEDERIYEAKSIIISTQTELKLLRRRMMVKKFRIAEEKVALENYKFYVVIKFIKGCKNYTARELYLGPLLIKDKSYDVFRYYESLFYENRDILKKIPNKYPQKRLAYSKHIDWIIELIGKKLGPQYWK